MYIKSNNNFEELISLLLKFLNNNNSSLNILFNTDNNISTKKDDNIYFFSGQLLMLLYICNVNNFDNKNIKYFSNTFYISTINYNYLPQTNIQNSTSESIIDDILYKSVFYKDYLPNGIKPLYDENLIDLENGFKLIYTILMKKKLEIIKLIESINLNINTSFLIQNLLLINPHDLELQLQFIKIKYNKVIYINDSLKNLKYESKNMDNFIDNSCLYLNLLIKNSIIGSGKYGLELMWIEYLNNTLYPTRIDNINFSLLSAFVGKKLNSKYYLEATKNSINPLLSYIDSFIENNLINDDILEVFKLLYLLNQYIDFSNLNNFINTNFKNKYFKNIKINNINNLKIEKTIFDYICNKSFFVFDRIIL